ncbi:hypothetical protein NFI96_008143 [Prochilodus magdalenae]|nr:hypothetical protein NFI96_008143 [Prochilodus magdalenae]
MESCVVQPSADGAALTGGLVEDTTARRRSVTVAVSRFSLSMNPGYYDISAEDMSVWHVPNNVEMGSWNRSSFLRYHTNSEFLKDYGGNLFELFKRYPVRYNTGSCLQDNGPSIPVVYDVGDAEFNRNLYGPSARGELEPGFITFRVFNREQAALAICSGVKPVFRYYDCNTEHTLMLDEKAWLSVSALIHPKGVLSGGGQDSVQASPVPPHQTRSSMSLWSLLCALYCIGGGGYFPEGAPRQCGDFPGFDWNGYGTNTDWSASREITEAALDPGRPPHLSLQITSKEGQLKEPVVSQLKPRS